MARRGFVFMDYAEDITPENLAVLQRLELCRTDYMFGVGCHPPERDTQRLAGKYDLTPLVVGRHQRTWLAELTVRAQTMSSVYGRAVDPETVESHEGDVAFLRRQLDALTIRMENIPDDMKGMETYEFLMKQYLKLQKRWSELSGVEGALSASKTAHLSVLRTTLQKALNAEANPQPEQPEEKHKGEMVEIFDLDSGPQTK